MRRGVARVVLPVHGLSYGGGGALTAERAIARTPGVLRAFVNPATEMAYVVYDPVTTAPSAFALAIESVGLRAGEPIAR